ncbi:MAG: hypothetical protein LC775_16695, partial [Acidobacteria bacterium]|nr:hypothetical protein [Acidobacteriota bacterium]
SKTLEASYMDWKRKLELICGLITSALGISITAGALYVTDVTARTLDEPAPMFKALIFSTMLYGLPGLVVGIGSYAHAVRSQSLGKALLIAASVFLTVWFFFSLVVLIWSRWVVLSWLIVLLTGFAILTSIVSLLVRGVR